MPEAAHSAKILRFGVFELDLRAGELRKEGLKVRMQEKPLQILTLLLEHAGEVVTREELRQQLWAPDTFVDFDHSVNTAINKLRESLGDSAENPRFIETLPRHGYRFIFPLTEPHQEHMVRPTAASKHEMAGFVIVPRGNRSDDSDKELAFSDRPDELTVQTEEIQRPPSGTAIPVPTTRKIRPLLGWGLAAVLLVLTVFLALAYIHTSRTPSLATRSYILPAEGTSFVFEPETGGPAISPDGKRLVFAARDASGDETLWVQPLDSLAAHRLEGTEGASFPFWSPDSRSIGFFVPGKLKRINIAGGPPQVVCDAENGRGGSWNSRGVIIFSRTGLGGLDRVPAAGGMPTPFTRLQQSREHYSQRWPVFLPDGYHFLYWEGTEGNVEVEDGNNGVYLRSLAGKGQRFLVPSDSNALYAPPGYLLFVRKGVLMVQRFDASRLKLLGDAFSFVGAVANPAWLRLGHFSVSQTGVLVYQTAGNHQTQLVWLDPSGKQVGAVGEPANIASIRLSPDGQTLAETVHDPQSNNLDIWLVDLIRGSRTRFIFDQAINMHPIWSPDGKSIVFASTRNGRHNLYIKNSNGTSAKESLLPSGIPFLPTDWSHDGRFIAFDQRGLNGEFDIWILPLSSNRKPFPFIQTQFSEPRGVFSPDSHWFAYESNESGTFEVYIVPFPGAGGKWHVSPGGGSDPKWRSDGKGLYYMAPGARLMEVGVTMKGSAVKVSRPHELFRLRSMWTYDVTPDSKRFLVLESEESASQKLTLVTNWTAGLKK